MSRDLMLIDQSGTDLMMRDASELASGARSRFFAGVCAREWRRAQARDKRRAEGAERVKAAKKKQAVKK